MSKETVRNKVSFTLNISRVSLLILSDVYLVVCLLFFFLISWTGKKP